MRKLFFLCTTNIDDDPLSFKALLLKTFYPSFLWRPFYDKKKEKEWKRRLWERMVRILKWRVCLRWVILWAKKMLR